MTLEEFSYSLRTVKAGKYASLPYALHADLFPPGEPDERARERCFKFAQSRGFRRSISGDYEVLPNVLMYVTFVHG
jgi:hypothetical protein